jgi:hypothetical protein
MAQRMSRSDRCKAGRHTPAASREDQEDVRRAVCRYCQRPIMRTQATRIWFLAAMLA